MKQPSEKREKWVNTRFTQTEYDTLQRLFRQTTCRELSEYIRKTVLGKPVNICYRNQSIDDYLADMLLLKKELNAIGNNFNQAVHRLRTLDRGADLQHWVLLNEQDKTILFRQIETINNRINQLHQLWSQE